MKIDHSKLIFKITPLVSIVTPSYNQAAFIEACIQSVINQDYTNIEYFVFDGGSKDGSVEIIKKYESKLSFWISEKDKGQSDAINKGWKMAKGDLLFYLNSDDLLFDSTVVSKIVAAYENNPNGAVFYGDCLIIDQDSKEVSYKKAQNTDTKHLLKERVFASILYQTSAFFNAKYVREMGFLNVNLHYCMDYDLILFLSTKGEMSRIDAPVACFRIHENSKSHNGMLPMMEEQTKIKWKYSKWDAIVYAFSYIKFRVFLLLPSVIQLFINPKLKKSLS